MVPRVQPEITSSISFESENTPHCVRLSTQHTRRLTQEGLLASIPAMPAYTLSLVIPRVWS